MTFTITSIVAASFSAIPNQLVAIVTTNCDQYPIALHFEQDMLVSVHENPAYGFIIKAQQDCNMQKLVGKTFNVPELPERVTQLMEERMHHGGGEYPSGVGIDYAYVTQDNPNLVRVVGTEYYTGGQCGRDCYLVIGRDISYEEWFNWNFHYEGEAWDEQVRWGWRPSIVPASDETESALIKCGKYYR